MKKKFAAAGLALASFGLPLASAPVHADPSEDALLKRVDALSEQLDQLKSELKQLKAQNEALAAQQERQSAAPSAATATATAAEPGVGVPDAHAGVVATVPSLLDKATLFGYGEIAYNHYDHDKAATEADLRRAVFGIGYRFDANTRFVSEFESEHAVASSDDAGEFEVEQFYIDHRITDWASIKAGLILIPSGILNEVHEPPRFYGVERNFVETAIIPSTWREGGIAVHGNVFNGFTYDVGLTTAQSLSKWDFTSTEGRESPLGSVHQELQLARASDLAQYAALNYNGYPGLNVGGSVFTGEIGQDQPNFPASPRTTLWEVHSRWTPYRFDLSALYTRGSITDTAGVNLINVGQPTPIPKSFYGWYVQGAYKLWQHNSYALNPFVRYERFNTASSYAGEPAGLGLTPLPTESVKTYGVNFYLNPNIVLKADYQNFTVDKNKDRFDLGLGFMFY
ncbi:MAG: hypothetical protein JWR16_3149 [Nevskia sp.]|nr:hypothetical protein [Nevskia sp.]